MRNHTPNWMNRTTSKSAGIRRIVMDVIGYSVGNRVIRVVVRGVWGVACLFGIAIGAVSGCGDSGAGMAGDPELPISRIAFGSCAKQDRPQPIWDTVIATKPDLFLFLGDNIYCVTQDEEVRAREYAKFEAIGGFRRLKKTCPILATWDDNDFGGPDAGGDYPAKTGSQKAFLDFFRVAENSPLRKQEGIYRAETFGPKGRRVQIILLDTRYFRGPLTYKNPESPKSGYAPGSDTSVTMLGEAQWKWLGKQLKEPADVRLLVSSIQVIAEDHGFEKWANLPHERQRLFDLIKRTGASGLIVLSGDRHFAELSEMDAGVGYPLYDLTASGLNSARMNVRLPEVNRHRVSTATRGHHFGMIVIDWGRSDPEIRLQILDIEGDILIQRKISLSDLKPGVWPS